MRIKKLDATWYTNIYHKCSDKDVNLEKYLLEEETLSTSDNDYAGMGKAIVSFLLYFRLLSPVPSLDVLPSKYLL